MPSPFAMYNVLKSDFLLARELLYEAITSTKKDSGLYFDTLDYAVYGRATAALVLAQRSALDLLDRIAVVVNEYLSVGLQPEKVHFRRFWREESAKAWRAPLAAEVAKGNVALVALSEIAADLLDYSKQGSRPGRLADQHELRNAGTHRFTVLHDMGDGRDSAKSSAVEHRRLGDFERATLVTLKLARAALLHLLECIEYRERRLRRDAELAGWLHGQVCGPRSRS